MRSAAQARTARSPLLSPMRAKANYKWNPGQETALELLVRKQTHTLLFGGGRSGKTFLFVKGLVQRALMEPNSRHLATRFRGNAVRASVWLDTFPKVMRICYPGIKHTTQRQDGFESFPNGSELWFAGLDDKDRVDKILGLEYATIYPGECSQIPYHSILVLRTRLAQKTGLRLRGWYDLNPVGQSHWTYREFVQHVDPVTRLPLSDPDDYQYATINPDQNADNLDPTYLKYLRSLPGKYGMRFYKGLYIVEVDGALWTADMLEQCRVEEYAPGGDDHKKLNRIAIGVDPSGASGKDDKKHDEIGIVAAGRTFDNRGVVLEDGSLRGSPKEWGTRVVAMFRRWKADIVVAEANFGGEMVRSTIHAVNANIPVKLVTASRGKVVRAEPISALYEDNRVDHAGRFIELEDQMCQFANDGYKGDKSPDRADAKIWALTELLLGEGADGVLNYYADIVAKAKAEREKNK